MIKRLIVQALQGGSDILEEGKWNGRTITGIQYELNNGNTYQAANVSTSETETRIYLVNKTTGEEIGEFSDYQQTEECLRNIEKRRWKN